MHWRNRNKKGRMKEGMQFEGEKEGNEGRMEGNEK